jgi:hypothetical protein
MKARDSPPRSIRRWRPQDLIRRLSFTDLLSENGASYLARISCNGWISKKWSTSAGPLERLAKRPGPTNCKLKTRRPEIFLWNFSISTRLPYWRC